jgi:hypothetical protein
LRRPIIKNNFKDTKKRKDVQGQVELYQQWLQEDFLLSQRDWS